MVDVELLYRQQLTGPDLELLRSAVGPQTGVVSALGAPETEAAVFGDLEGSAMKVGVSPFLAFATALHRTAARLETTSFVEERWAPRVRVPVFDVGDLRALVSDPLRRWFLVDLLASYTRVSSGVMWTRTPRGWRRRRFSELDPVSLAEQLALVGPAERAGVYRRLGDLALFLLGVFPDHPPRLAGVAGERLLRLGGSGVDSNRELDGAALLERLGSRWYEAAVASARAAGCPVTAPLAVAGHMGEHFGAARRVLNAVTDRYLFPLREQWFGR